MTRGDWPQCSDTVCAAISNSPSIVWELVRAGNVSLLVGEETEAGWEMACAGKSQSEH